MLIPTKPQEVTWTDAQWRAIFATGRDVLVSAAAGSGKTAVLIERLIQKMIRTDNQIDVDQLLVVTFTNASAAEMPCTGLGALSLCGDRRRHCRSDRPRWGRGAGG